MMTALLLAHSALCFWLGWRWRYISALRHAERSASREMRELARLVRQGAAEHG